LKKKFHALNRSDRKFSRHFLNARGIFFAQNFTDILAHFPIGKEAIVRTLSICPSVRLSPLLVFMGLTDWGDLWLDRKLMIQGSESW
jgi:hypothetical protein